MLNLHSGVQREFIFAMKFVYSLFINVYHLNNHFVNHFLFTRNTKIITNSATMIWVPGQSDIEGNKREPTSRQEKVVV